MRKQTILLPTDFSRASEAALGFAQCLANQYGFELHLLHIFPYIAHHRYAAPVGWMISELRSNARKSLQGLKNLAEKSGCKVHALLEDCTGNITDQIVKHADSAHVEMIVMGTHSKQGIERFIVGSTAEGVLRNTKVPVITIGPHVSDYAGQMIRRIVLATDLSERSLPAVEALRNLVNENTSLDVVHVSQNEENQDWQGCIRNVLSNVLPAEVLAKQVSFHWIRSADPARAVTRFARLAHADLLVIGLHAAGIATAHLAPRTGFQMVMSSPCAVMSVCGLQPRGQ